MIQNETVPLHNKTLNRSNPEKLYVQLTRIFLDKITSGQWQSGSQIPTEIELCRKYGVSKITVRQALRNLAQDGYVMKIQGKGTFVNDNDQSSGYAMKTRFTEDMFGKEVQVNREVVARGIQSTGSPAHEYLHTEEEIYRIVSQRVVEGEPISMDELYIPVSVLPGAHDLDFTEKSLLATLQERGTAKIYKVVQTVEIAPVPKEYTAKLRVADDTPALVVHRMFYDLNGIPVAYTRLLGRSDRFKFQTEFERIR